MERTKRIRGRAPRPLDSEKLRDLALFYVGHFATTRAKLRQYLGRKVRERGWTGTEPPNIEDIVERLAAQGYVDDSEFALAKARAMSARGLGQRRIDQALCGAGVEEGDRTEAQRHSEKEIVASALRFARRRRIGPFAATEPTEPRDRERALAALVRAGHPFELAKAIIAMAPGSDVDPEQLAVDLRLAAP